MFGAAIALAGASTALAAQPSLAAEAAAAYRPGNLLAIYREAVARKENWPSGLSDEDNLGYDNAICALERQVASAPCTCRSDAIAKISHAIDGLRYGEMGTEEGALEQVITFLGAN